MNMLIFAAAMAAAFMLGAYVRRPFALFSKKERPKAIDAEEPPKEKNEKPGEEYAERINRQLAELINYTGRKSGEG